MSLTLVLRGLKSRAVREAIAGVAGIRTFQSNAQTDIERTDGGFWNSLVRFGKFLVSQVITKLSFNINIDLKKIWGMIWSVRTFLWNFNWNADNKELDAQVKRAEIALGAARGRLKGVTLGYAVCGIAPAAGIAVFNEALGVQVMRDVGEEAAEEIGSALANLIQLQMTQWVRIAFMNTFKNQRGFLRGAAIGFAQLAVKAGFIDQESVDKANKERNKPWSLAGAFEDSIERIPDPVKRAEVEEFWEELGDACMEAGYIVAGGLDRALAERRLVEVSMLGSETIVEILPRRASGATG